MGAFSDVGSSLRIESQVSHYINTGEPMEESNLMEFRLLYDGELAGNSAKARDKHAIRKQLHPQLRRLWNTEIRLRQYAAHVGLMSSVSVPITDKSEEERAEIGLAAIGKNFSRAGYELVPLVTAELALRCALDILLLRPSEGKKTIFEGGDMDNQIKTLFDGLKIPQNANDLGGNVPGPDENPFFCLLEDDRLISEVRVVTDQLLVRPHQVAIRQTDVFAVIYVKLNHNPPRFWDNYFG